LWAFRGSLLIRPATCAITLGEGRTPLVTTPDLAEALNIGSLWLKIEPVNPTGSSSGNALHAQAAYAARAGLRSIALVPENVPTSRLVQPIVCGTRVVRVRGDYSDCHRFALELAQKTGWYNTSTTYENPIGTEGYKTIAYEIWKQLDDVADWVVLPVGAGPLLGAVGRGFEDLFRQRCTDGIPALLGVQSTECAPVARAFERGDDAVTPWEGEVHTTDRGIADPLRGYAEDGAYTLRWAKRTGGAVVSVEEDAILGALSELGHTCHLYVDPAAVAAVVGIRAAVRGELIPEEATVVCIITGTGFKEVPVGIFVVELDEVFAPHTDAIAHLLRKEG